MLADVNDEAADPLVDRLLAVCADDERYVLSRLEVVAGSDGPSARGFSWAEVLGEARANARPLARYLSFMGVAGVLAGLGVIDRNAVLIVGARDLGHDDPPAAYLGVAFGVGNAGDALGAVGILAVNVRAGLRDRHARPPASRCASSRRAR